VDDERPFVLGVCAALKTYSSDFNVFAAENGKSAVKILNSASIELVVTDLRMPEMDGFELLAYMNNNFPSIPVIVLSAYGTPDTKKRLKTLKPLYYLQKPVNFYALNRAIIDGLKQESKEGFVENISVSSFLQLIEMEQKTCLLEIQLKGNGQQGFFYFIKGILRDAICGDIKGEDAALKMIAWDNVVIKFKDLPKKKIENRIKTGLMALIMEAMRLKDESPEKDEEAASEKVDTAQIQVKDLKTEVDNIEEGLT
jgi:CheY-like chemotaxis protein